MKLDYVLTVVICALYVVGGQTDVITRSPFDQELYKSVLNSELCGQQIQYMMQNQALLLQFLDAGFRLPSGIFEGNTQHLGNYFQCLNIHGEIQENPIQGKYCMTQAPLSLQLLGELNGNQIGERNSSQGNESDQVNSQNAVGGSAMMLRFGLCIPQACTVQEWATNVSVLGLQYEEQYCRLPNDKPWVAADYVAIVIFSVIGLVTILSTCYDLYHTHTLKTDPKQISPLYGSFSVYTNARRLITFTKSSNALDCLDGIRTLSMIWIIIGHSFFMYTYNSNMMDVMSFISSVPSVLVSTNLFAVDTFFFMTGLLLVYTSIGKMKSKQLLKGLHMFYIRRILRLLPLLATLVLLEASFLHRIGDGPYWIDVASNTQRCRDWWWSTLLFVQNIVNSDTICVPHSWYLAIDMQLHIISPIVLVWVLSGKKNVAWSALLGGLLVSLTASTIFNFIMDFPSYLKTFTRFEDLFDYMRYYYRNTLTRSPPFFHGMILGYILNINKGRNFKLHKFLVALFWIFGLVLFASIFYGQYEIVQTDYDNQLGDNFFNSFARSAWSLGLSWLIFACIYGYGGPINWFLSLSMWKLPSRISYAMYLFHYPFIFIVAGMQVAPVHWSPAKFLFDSLTFFALAFLASFALMVFIDAPFSNLTKMVIGDGPKRPREIKNEAKPEESLVNTIEVKSDDRNNV